MDNGQYHYLAPSPNDPPDRDINPFRCETNAYRRLKAKGFCKRGVIPDFYGVIEWIEPREWGPHLDMFLDDSWSPSAVLIEYVADMHQMDLSTFSKSRLASLRAILGEFHEAKVFHSDADPRNMMVVSGKPDRVLWIDFDTAQTLPENKSLTQRQQEWMESEILRMDYFVYGLVCSRWILTNIVLIVHLGLRLCRRKIE
jgi:hypothetical protein